MLIRKIDKTDLFLLELTLTNQNLDTHWSLSSFMKSLRVDGSLRQYLLLMK